MKRRIFLGLDLAPHSFRAVALRRQGREVALVGARMLKPDPAVVRFSAREPNLVERFRFVSQLREILTPLAEQEERLSLSLPDRVGRVILTEVESGFKSHDEGVEILKWQLKNSLPGDARNTTIDFQVVGQSEAGRQRVLVAAVRNDILVEYQDAIEEAGFGAGQVDFHASNLYAYYRSRLNLDESMVLISAEGETLSLQFFVQAQPVYARSTTVACEATSVFQELSRTLVSAASGQPQLKKATVYLHTDWEAQEPLVQAIEGCFEREVQVLDVLKGSGIQFHHARPQALAAAIGAAERQM